MANTDKFILNTSASPRIWNNPTNDAVGKFVNHNDLGGNLGGGITILGATATGTARWIYYEAVAIEAGDTTIFSAGNYTDGTAIDLAADFCLGLYLRHTGLNDSGDVDLTDNIMWNFQGEIGPQGTGFMLLPYESMAVRFSTAAAGQYDPPILNTFEAETGPNPSVNMMLEVLAFCDDVAAP